MLKLAGYGLFREDVSNEISFKLRRLTFGPATYEAETQRNFNLFLKTQTQTLKILTIFGYTDVAVVKTIFSMPSLIAVCLAVDTIQGLEISEATFPQNQSVFILILTEFWVDMTALKVILKGFPKLQTLKIANITDEIADSISAVCTTLEILDCDYFFAKNVTDEKFFLKLKQFTCQEFSLPESPGTDSQKLFEKLNGKLVKDTRKSSEIQFEQENCL